MKSRVVGCLIALIATLGLLVDVQAQTSTAPMDFATPKPKLSADELLRLAQQQLNTGMYDLAESGFHALLDDEDCQIRDDCQAVASLGLAECLFATGRYDDAASILSDGQESSGDSADWYVLRAEVAGAVGDYKEGIRLARKARGKDQTSCKARLVLARFLEAIGESDAALDEYRWFDRLVQHRLPIDAENLTAAGAGFYRYSV
ncbi:MAG: tetratricopeptide repeat protein, partial [Planctomycetes bacterium]|nr:tetratricopeptide repeat protein [Planctomycetota bacterium]